jgi:2-polyprenyl-6-methoxyphenol hydroxylase-like FAD-dependent oxidoreductase
LEDVCVLERQLFEASAGDLSQALPAFEQQRLPDSAALVKLVQVRAAVYEVLKSNLVRQFAWRFVARCLQQAWVCKTWPASTTVL